MALSLDDDKQLRWYVMRDLKRANAKYPAYKMLMEKEMCVFTPMTCRLSMERGRRVRKEVPFISDLLFVYADRKELDPIVEKTPTLQYRWLHNTYRAPMTVPTMDMQRFIHAVMVSDSPKYYSPEEITPEMYGRRIYIVGGPFDGYEGTLLTTRGSKTKRLLIELPKLLAVGVEVHPDFIRMAD